MKRLAVAFTGPSNSGKTTIIEKIAQILTKDYKVAIVKHDPKDKAVFDKEGKDSYKFSKVGADVIMVSPTRTTLFKQSTSSIEDIISLFGDFDYLIVEGLKTLPLPRIGVFRESLNENYFDYIKAIAVDNSIDKNEVEKITTYLDLNNPQMIIEWINKNAKKV